MEKIIEELTKEINRLVLLIPTVNSNEPRKKLKEAKLNLVKALVIRDKEKIQVTEGKTAFGSLTYTVDYDGQNVGTVDFQEYDNRWEAFGDEMRTANIHMGRGGRCVPDRVGRSYSSKREAILYLLAYRLYGIEIDNWSKGWSA